MFWGLILEPGKGYSQEVVKAFHISMATLEMDGDQGVENNIPVLLKYGDGREFVLCNLNPIKREQCALDLNFRKGEKIGFYTGSRQINVHLTGYTLTGLEELSEDDDSEEEEDEEEEEEPEEMKEISWNIPQKRKKSPIKSSAAKKKKLINEIEKIVEEASDEMTTPTKKNVLLQSAMTSGNEKGEETKKIKKKKKVIDPPVKEQNGQMQSPTSESVKKKKKKKTKKKSELHQEIPKATSPQKKTVEGGVQIVDTIIGNGPVAKPGGKVAVYYVGRLAQNNKLFDATTSGEAFKFMLGNGEVIKGWDVGVSGMRVGGKRTLTIPGDMAYGKKGRPPVIPPHSTLVFDIELKNVFH